MLKIRKAQNYMKRKIYVHELSNSFFYIYNETLKNKKSNLLYKSR